MKNVEFDKIQESRIGKYFNNLLYGYIRFYQGNLGISYEDYIIRMQNDVFFKFWPLQKYYLISQLQYNTIFYFYSTYLRRIF